LETGDIVKVKIEDMSFRNGIFFEIEGACYQLSTTGEIRKVMPENLIFVCHSYLVTEKERFISLDEVRVNYENGAFSKVLNALKSVDQ
jgi:hypothetical protein